MLNVLTLAVLSALVGILIPESKNDSLRKAVAFLAGLSLLIAVCEPVVRAADQIALFPEQFFSLLMPDREEAEEIRQESEAWVVRCGIENVERGVSALIEKRFGMRKGAVVTKAETEREAGGDILIASLEISISDAEQCDLREVEEYIESLLACPCHARRVGGEADE